jgi:hypothetical protein
MTDDEYSIEAESVDIRRIPKEPTRIETRAAFRKLLARMVTKDVDLKALYLMSVRLRIKDEYDSFMALRNAFIKSKQDAIKEYEHAIWKLCGYLDAMKSRSLIHRYRKRVEELHTALPSWYAKRDEKMPEHVMNNTHKSARESQLAAAERQ